MRYVIHCRNVNRKYENTNYTYIIYNIVIAVNQNNNLKSCDLYVLNTYQNKLIEVLYFVSYFTNVLKKSVL